MQPWIMTATLAVLVGLSPVVFAGASQNPHDPSNQASDEESQNPHDSVNQPDGTGFDTGTPNPNSLGRTGRGDQIGGDGSIQSDEGEAAPSVNDNPSSRIEDINDDDRRLRDRLDGRTDTSVDPGYNSDNPGEPVPPGQGPGVDDATGMESGNSATSASDVAPRAGSRSGRARSGGSAGGSSGTGGAR